MDPRVVEMMGGGAPKLPPGILQIKTFSRSHEESEQLDAEANAFLVEMNRDVKVVDFRTIVGDGRLTALFVLHVPMKAT